MLYDFVHAGGSARTDMVTFKQQRRIGKVELARQPHFLHTRITNFSTLAF